MIDDRYRNQNKEKNDQQENESGARKGYQVSTTNKQDQQKTHEKTKAQKHTHKNKQRKISKTLK